MDVRFALQYLFNLLITVGYILVHWTFNGIQNRIKTINKSISFTVISIVTQSDSLIFLMESLISHIIQKFTILLFLVQEFIKKSLDRSLRCFSDGLFLFQLGNRIQPEKLVAACSIFTTLKIVPIIVLWQNKRITKFY